MAKAILTREYLIDRLTYNPSTGLFLHNHTFGERYKKGDRADTPGHSALSGYRLVNLLNQKFLAHRIAWMYVYGNMPSNYIDHINGNKSDNRIENLRVVSCRGNVENRRFPSKRNKTGFLGVHFHQGKFRASITVDRKRIHIGMFDKPEEAYKAYVEAKRKHHEGCTL